MKDQIKITVYYFRLKNYFMEHLGYSDEEAACTIQDIRQMNPIVRRAFLAWFTTGREPEHELLGIDYQNLVEYRSLNPAAAFIAIDWYAGHPEEAFSVLGVSQKDRMYSLTEDCGREIAEAVQKFPIPEYLKTKEDTSDISG